MFTSTRTRLLALLFGLTLLHPALAHEPTIFRFGWHDYSGGMPWGHAQKSGILERWGKRYKVRFRVKHYSSYHASISDFVDGKLDGTTMTNLEAINHPAAAGIDTTAFLITGHSEGADGIVLKRGNSVQDLKNQRIALTTNSASYYLLQRALSQNRLDTSSLQLVDLPQNKLLKAIRSENIDGAVLWNPNLSKAITDYKLNLVYDSSNIPREIFDMVVAHSHLLHSHPEVGLALVGAWFETVQTLYPTGQEGLLSHTNPGKQTGINAIESQLQMAGTNLFLSPAEAVSAMKEDSFIITTQHMRLLSENNKRCVEAKPCQPQPGIAFPSGHVIGDRENIRMRYSSQLMEFAARGLLPPIKHTLFQDSDENSSAAVTAYITP